MICNIVSLLHLSQWDSVALATHKQWNAETLLAWPGMATELICPAVQSVNIWFCYCAMALRHLLIQMKQWLGTKCYFLALISSCIYPLWQLKQHSKLYSQEIFVCLFKSSLHHAFVTTSVSLTEQKKNAICLWLCFLVTALETMNRT